MDSGAGVLVYNSRGELALQLRAKREEHYPLHWDISAAGALNADEEPLVAASRELQEELGITCDLTFHGSYVYPASGETLHVYRASYDGAFYPDPCEVEEVRWFSLVEIERMIAMGEKFHPEFVYFWNLGVIR